MMDTISNLQTDVLRENLDRVREEIAMAAERAGRDARTVEVLATTKYVAIEDLPRLVEAGIRLVGENRAIDLEEKASSGTSGAFNWDFIGQLQSRRVRKIVPYARLIHS